MQNIFFDLFIYLDFGVKCDWDMFIIFLTKRKFSSSVEANLNSTILNY